MRVNNKKFLNSCFYYIYYSLIVQLFLSYMYCEIKAEVVKGEEIFSNARIKLKKESKQPWESLFPSIILLTVL